MEVLDILNEFGEPLGFTKARSLVHRDGDWHRTAHVWILKDHSELLLQHRGLNQESNPNKWDVSCAGHCSAGDASQTAALRELREELGWNMHKDRLIYLGEIKSERILPGLVDREYSDIYLLEVVSPTPCFELQESEVQGVEWVRQDVLKHRVLKLDPVLVDHQEEYQLLFKWIEAQKA